jgi:hypothetical protein
VPRPKGGTVPSTATITRGQRDGLYWLARNDIGSAGDIWVALEQNEDYAAAERLAIELGEDFRLLHDLGWRPDEGRDVFELTIPPHDLMELLQRLRSDAERLIRGFPHERQSRDEDEMVNERFRVGRDACAALLTDLDPREEKPRARRHPTSSSPSAMKSGRAETLARLREVARRASMETRLGLDSRETVDQRQGWFRDAVCT